MRSSKRNEAQHRAWLLAGSVIPLAVAAAESGWILAAMGAAIALLLIMIKKEPERLPLWQIYLRVAMLTLLTGIAGQWLTRIWPGENPAVAVILLLLAAHASRSGPEKPARIGSVLNGLILIGGSFILFYGIGDLQDLERIRNPEGNPEMLIVILLILLTTTQWEKSEEGKGLKGILPMLLIIIATAFMAEQAVRPGQVVPEGKRLLQWVSGLTSNGKPLRLEVWMSMLMTMGWYCQFTLCLCRIRQYLSLSGKEDEKRYGLWIATAAAIGIILLDWGKEEWLIAPVILLWTVIPAIAQLIENKKEKTRKRG